MIKKIEKPNWEELFKTPLRSTIIDAFDDWFFEFVVPNNRDIENAVEVRGTRTGNYALEWSEENPLVDRGFTHKALLINIEPIKEETAENVLREWIKQPEYPGSSLEIHNIIERAKAVLEQDE